MAVVGSTKLRLMTADNWSDVPHSCAICIHTIEIPPPPNAWQLCLNYMPLTTPPEGETANARVDTTSRLP